MLKLREFISTTALQFYHSPPDSHTVALHLLSPPAHNKDTLQFQC